MRVSLPGYNAGTDTNLDHYALYSDQDNILIKEFARGTTTLGSFSSGTISHNLGYIPMYEVRVDGKEILGYNIYSEVKTYIGTSSMVLINNFGFNVTFKYYIFYDLQK
jgi:hypothetical protein